MAASFTDQTRYEARFDWGEAGLRALAPYVSAVVIVDVLSFTTAVSVAIERGAIVYPHRWHDESALSRANELGAALAVSRARISPESSYSLSPGSLQTIPRGTKLVLPSPNGATLSAIAGEYGCTVLAGCLRNATAVGRACAKIGESTAVIAAGERWSGNAGLRPAFEDLIGAGAIIEALRAANYAPEALAAIGAFDAARNALDDHLVGCASGRELIERGYPDDVAIASALDISDHVPVLIDGAYRSLQAL
jgi:2-phosphosulfolactate phosphatase